METKQGSHEEGEAWLQNLNININNGDDDHNHHDDDDGDEGLCVLKREIACHSLYNLLLQSHLNCLKLCLGKVESSIENVMINPTALPKQHADQSELDQFMEAYCMSLKKLKEVMEEPQQESMAFINLMHSQLDELLLQNNPNSSPEELRFPEMKI